MADEQDIAEDLDDDGAPTAAEAPGDVDECLELVAPDEGSGPDTEAAAVASAYVYETDDTALEREGVRPAEEVAMHVVDEDQLF